MSACDRDAAPDPAADAVDLRTLPLAAGAWAAAWWAVSPSRLAGAALLAGVTLAAGLLARVGQRLLGGALVAVVVCCAVTGLLREDQLVTSRVAVLATGHATAVLEVRTTSDGVVRARHGAVPAMGVVPGRVVLIQARDEAVRQPVTVELRAPGEVGARLARVPAGSLLRVEVRLAPALPGRGQAARATVRGAITVVRPPRWHDRAVNHLRAGLHAAMRRSSPAPAGLLPSLVVGDTSGLDPGLEDAFKATALTHLTAVSGTNLTLSLAFLLTLARWCGVRGWWVRLVGLSGVMAFVVVCRAEPSVLRAGAMGLVALAGTGVAGGRGRGLRNLCVAVWLLVMVDPPLARSVGFALSVLATGGILWFGGRWGRAMRRWAPGWLAEAIAIPLAAQVATQPLVTWISGNVSVVGLAANAAAEPFVGPATILGLTTALVAVVSPWLASWVGWVAGWCVRPIIWVAQRGAALPAATWRWPASTPMVVLLGVACGAATILVPRLLVRRWACVAAACLLVVAGLRQPRPLGWPGPWQVAFCDVGQGDTTVLRAGDGQAVVVDVGPEGPASTTCLRQLGIRRVVLLVLTHYHDDHIGALDQVLRAVPVGRLMVNPVASPASAALRVRRLAAAHGVPVTTAALGEHLRVGDADWTTVGLGAQDLVVSSSDGENSAENDTSVVAVVQVGQLRVVIGGDVEPIGQQRVVAAGWNPHLTVLKMPHHGSSRQDAHFWCDSGARLAVASAGYHNDYGHPARAALQLASHCGMQVARTDLQGTITTWVADGLLQVRAERDGPP